MSTDRDARPSGIDARGSRRWLIGIVISVFFGLFSVVMGLLSYFGGAKATAPPGAKPPAGRDDARPARRDWGKGERRK